MKTFSRIVYFLLPIVMIACNQVQEVHFHDEEGHQIDEERYSNGQTKLRKVYLNAEKTSYTQSSYYEDGTLKDSMSFVDAKLEGTKSYYDKSARLTHYENYHNGIMQGVNEAIYDNGFFSYKGFRHNGQKAGEWIFRYPDGRPITYELYDSTGRLKYFRKFDENGNYQQSEGSVIIGADISASQMNRGDTVFLQLFVALPPFSNALVSITGTINSDVQYNYEETISTSKVSIPVSFSMAGDLSLNIVVEISDTRDDHVESDQKTLQIKVN